MKIIFITIGTGVALFIGIIALAVIAAFLKAVHDIGKWTDDN